MLSGRDTRAHSRLTIADSDKDTEGEHVESALPVPACLHPEPPPKHHRFPSVFQFPSLFDNASDSELFDTPRRQQRCAPAPTNLSYRRHLFLISLLFELCESMRRCHGAAPRLLHALTLYLCLSVRWRDAIQDSKVIHDSNSVQEHERRASGGSERSEREGRERHGSGGSRDSPVTSMGASQVRRASGSLPLYE